MLHCIQSLSHDAGKTFYENYQYRVNTYVLVLRLQIIWHDCSLFSKYNENSTTRLRSLCKVFRAL